MSKYDRIRVLSCDHLNLARGKYISAKSTSNTIRMCRGLCTLGYDRVMVPEPDCLPDLIAKFDRDSIRVGWEDRVGIVVADMATDEHISLPLCGRSFLKIAVEKWQSLELYPQIGFELEAFLFRRSDSGEWLPYDTPGAHVYGTGATIDPAGIIEQIWQQSEACGFNVVAIHSEYDWPQLEFSMGYSDALQAIDEVFLFRLMATEICLKAGFKLSFMPKPLSDRGSSGCHINLSMVNNSGENMLAQDTKEDGLSDICKICIAGLLHHHKGLAGLLAPTVNSYRRLRPGNMTGYWGNWGYDHRGTAIRIPGERGKNTRIEYRLADGAANPYIAVAATLQAAFLAYQNQYTLPSPEDGNSVEVANTELCVADSLGQALDDLELDQSLVKAIGEDIVKQFLAIKRAEWQRFLAYTTDWEFNEYINFL